MAAELEKLNGTLQENIISLLAHSDKHGKIIAANVQPQLFEGEYRVIAERCVDYWKRHGEAPKFHMVDLVDDIISDKSNRKSITYKRILNSMLDLVENINVDYVLTQLTAFTRMQRFKDAILKSAEQLNSQQQVALVEVEKMWNELLRESVKQFDGGTKLTDFKMLLDYLESQYAEFITGVKALDDANIVPSRGAVFLLLAAAKRGKSWFLINCGARAVQMRKRVLHISLEMHEPQCLQRYYQCLFTISKSDRHVVNRVLNRDDDGHLASLEEETIKLGYTLLGNSVDSNLRISLRELGPRAEYLRIKKFPTRSVTVDDIDAYIDNLEVTEGFIPDMIILDYPAILKIDGKNPRIAVGRMFEDFRGMCDRRNVAGVAVHQLSKAGAEAMTASSTNIAEDWSMVATADIIVVFSSTDAEKALGLGRLRVTNARDAEDNFGCLITQNYKSGQFCIDSIRLSSDYYDMLQDLKIENDLQDDGESDADDADED
jgi:hypothetical protein